MIVVNSTFLLGDEKSKPSRCPTPSDGFSSFMTCCWHPLFFPLLSIYECWIFNYKTNRNFWFYK